MKHFSQKYLFFKIFKGTRDFLNTLYNSVDDIMIEETETK